MFLHYNVELLNMPQKHDEIAKGYFSHKNIEPDALIWLVMCYRPLKSFVSQIFSLLCSIKPLSFASSQLHLLHCSHAIWFLKFPHSHVTTPRKLLGSPLDHRSQNCACTHVLPWRGRDRKTK